MKQLQIEDNCIENFNHENHKRGKNWVARVTKNRQAPGGIAREFFKRGSGNWYVLPDDLKTGDQLEFGGDYYSGSGTPHRSRKYALIITVCASALDVIDIDAPLAADKIETALDSAVETLAAEITTLN